MEKDRRIIRRYLHLHVTKTEGGLASFDASELDRIWQTFLLSVYKITVSTCDDEKAFVGTYWT